MKKFTMDDVGSTVPKGSRELDEQDKVDSVKKRNGNRRRRKGRDKTIIIRVTEEEKERITKLADALSYTYTDTLLAAIEELEKKFGKGSGGET